MDQNNPQTLSFLPLGGIEDVTKNMYLYLYGDEILIVDCGLGFADETMLGVDLLLPDTSHLLDAIKPKQRHPHENEDPSILQDKSDSRLRENDNDFRGKRIVGMVLSHGHEDHIGALPFILPQLPKIPMFATPLTAALANEKLREFQIKQTVQTVNFGSREIRLGSFAVSFIRVTHSVPDTANILIKTPAGSLYHGSDFKIDLTPADKKPTEYLKIAKAGEQGVLALMSDCLGAERKGFSRSENDLGQKFEEALRSCSGKCIITTYSSNISRLNQAIKAASNVGRKVCFVGKSLIKVKTIAKKLGYLQMNDGMEVPIDKLKRYKDNELLLLVAGSQGQENSAMMRIANDEHRDVSLSPGDLIILSSDIIPGNEVLVHAMIDAIAEKGARVFYRDITDIYHVSGHGTAGDLMLMMSLVNAKYLAPISGTFRQMVAYKELAKMLGYKDQQIILLENGQEIVFLKDKVVPGRKVEIKNVYVDEISGEEVESFVLRDRERLAKEGVVIVLAEVSSTTGEILNTPEIIARGFLLKDITQFSSVMGDEIKTAMSSRHKHVKNWVHARRVIEEVVSNFIDKKLHRRPLVLPVVIEV